jgi:hypothetical protein
MILYDSHVSGSLTISSSATIGGTLTAQTIVAQTITSSIEFITGSTRNGSLLANTHQFTGSVGITGSLTANGYSNFINNASTGVLKLQNLSATGWSSFEIFSSSNSTVGGFGWGNASAAALASTMYFDVIGNNPFIIRTNSTERIRFFGDGNVGINTSTTNAGFRLDVNGTTRLNGDTTVTGSLRVTSAVTASAFSGAGTGLTGTASGLSIGGNAATSTQAVVTVTGTNSAELIRGNMADNDQFRILVGGTATNAGYAEIATADDGTEPIYVRQYTGTFTSLTRTLTLLDGSGNTTFPGTITENSSMRYKKNIQTINNGLDKVLQMRGVTYNKKDNNLKEIGVIAEEINEILPDVVIKNSDGQVDSVSYGRIVAVLIEAIKEQQQQIDELKSKLL